MTKLNYIAKHEGSIVGTRSSSRIYTHAIVVQYDEAWYRERAHSLAYAEQCNCKRDFAYYTETVVRGVEGELARWKYTSRKDAEERLAKAERIVALGYNGWVAERLQANIADHEKIVANGGFTPAIVTWCGRPDLAHKEAAKRRGERDIAKVWIVPVETVAKLPKIAGERKHASYGPHSD